MEDKNLSTSLVRGLAILSSFSEDEPLLGITDIAGKLELNKSTVHRYVHTLKTLGYLEQDEDTKKYRLGVRVMDLGVTVLGGMELRQVALPYLENLATTFGHTVNMAVLDQNEIIYVERVRTGKIGNFELHVGTRLPAYCTAMGKVLLAHLPAGELERVLSTTALEQRGPNTITTAADLRAELERVCVQGFAINDEELAHGLRSVAAPVRSRRGEVVAAINMAVQASLTSRAQLVEDLAPPLLETAYMISRKLGYHAQRSR